MRTPIGQTASAYQRRPIKHQREPLIDAYANELRIGDRVTSAVLPGPEWLPTRLIGLTGDVVELGRVRVGVRYGAGERVEHLDPHGLLVTTSVDGRHLLGPT